MNQSNQRVVFMRDRGRVTIPVTVRERFGLEEGSELILTEEENRLILYPRGEARLEELLDQTGTALKEGNDSGRTSEGRRANPIADLQGEASGTGPC